jgi:imidazoleglycerol-phosphate dehydratase
MATTKKARRATIKRKTTETDISLSINIDGKGTSAVKTGIPFFDHMLTLFSKHGLIDLKIKAKGDIEVDFHHTVEDIGLCLGEALKKALGKKAGIKRYGRADVPMMDSLATIVLDLSGRPSYKFTKTKESTKACTRGRKDDFDMGLTHEFMVSLVNTTGIDLHISLPYGQDRHHAIEAIFKALGRALRDATEKDPRIKGVMTTKGSF